MSEGEGSTALRFPLIAEVSGEMQFQGIELFDCARAELWGRLTDMQFVSCAIPDVDKVTRVEPREFACRVKPRFSFLTGSLDLQFEVVEADEPVRLAIVSRGKGIGGAVVVGADIQLAEVASGTELNWIGTIRERQGLLKPVSAGLIQGAAQRVIGDFWKRFRSALAENKAVVRDRVLVEKSWKPDA